MQTLNPDGRHPIGPFTRVLAAVFLAAVARLAGATTLTLWRAPSLALMHCPSGRRYPLFCELIRAVLTMFPPPLQGPLGAMLTVAFIVLLLVLVVWLLKPLVQKRRR